VRPACPPTADGRWRAREKDQRDEAFPHAEVTAARGSCGAIRLLGQFADLPDLPAVRSCTGLEETVTAGLTWFPLDEDRCS
jgi:hypothetical protein